MHHRYYRPHSVNEYTATYYAGLYCDKKTDRNFIQSALYIGSILGLLFLTPYADEKGKKKMFVISQGVCIVGLLCTSEIPQ
jgi:MFS family permease